MFWAKWSRIAAAALAVGAALDAPLQGQGPQLAMLDRIEPGRWELRLRDAEEPVRKLCISNGRGFIQLRHPGTECERYVVQDTATDVIVQYTCRGRGYGRTHVRRETGSLVQIESQGIAGGLPFEFAGEARRVGECAS